MAKRTITTLTDDLDGTEASMTVEFSLDGNQYEIDLNEQHADELKELLGRYVVGARNAGTSTGRASKPKPSSSGPKPDAKTVRAWAAEQGIEVNARGRIRPDVVDRFLAAQ